MSPEQARGHAADRRADIWSFGVVLYEMLTGKRPFLGSTVSDTLAAILRADVDLDALPAETPVPVRRLLRRCLAKDPAQRLQAIGDARLELREALDSPERAVDSGQVASVGRRKNNAWVLGLVAATLVAVTAAIWGWMRPSAAPQELTRLSIALPTGQELQAAPSISRNGRQIAYVARQGVEPTKLYVRALDTFDARAIPGTENADQPFLSPDGRAVGFYADGSLKIVELSGGSPRVLAAAPSPFGATWADDDHIIFTTTINAGLMRIPSAGGPIENLTKPDMGAKGYAHTWPRALPGGEAVVFSVWGGQGAPSGTAILDRTEGTWRMLVPDVSGGRFVESGYILTPWDFEAESDRATLRASVFSGNEAGPLTIDATVLEGVISVPWRSESWVSLASNGTLAYVPGTVADRRLVWVDQQGNIAPATDSRAVYQNASLSPDGRRAAVKDGIHLSVYDLEGGTRIRLTTVGDNGDPAWDVDGKRVFFSSNSGGDWDVYARAADGTGETELLWKREYSQWVESVAPDGTLLISEPNPETGLDLWIRDPDGETRPFLITAFNESAGRFSPDGSLIAYTSNESGRDEIYVLPYPGPGPRVPISREGGWAPRWSKDGKMLFYFQGEAVVSARLERAPELEVVERRELFSGKFLTRYAWAWDVAPDGRFLMIQRGPGSVPDRINVVLNWTSELRRLVPRR